MRSRGERGDSDLLERREELAALGAAVDAVAAGRPRVVLVEGAAGIGKSVLLASVARDASDAGLPVLHARGGELERDYPFGIVLQLFEPVVRSAPPAARERLLTGAAGLAAPVLGLGGEESDPPDGPFAAVHGLYWLAVALADTRPHLLCIDDLHWADEASLRWLSYLVRRLDDVPLGIVATRRPAEPGASPLLGDIAAEPDVERVAPRTLSAQAALTVVAAAARSPVEPAFAAACHAATGGNPLLLQELTRAIGADGLAPTDDHATRVADLAPPSVVDGVRRRLEGLAPAALELARATAVLGPEATLDVAAEVADVALDDAARLVTVLVDAGVLEAGPVMTFVHPIVRTAVVETLAPAERIAVHVRCASALRARRALDEVVAAHLLTVPPAALPWAAQVLHAAADTAARRGADEFAMRCLRHALPATPDDERWQVLFALGRLEAQAGGRAPLDTLRAALDAAPDPVARATVVRVLALELGLRGRGFDAGDVDVAAILDDVAPLDRELALWVEADVLCAGILLLGYRPWRVDPTALGDTAPERAVLGAAGYLSGDLTASIELCERALGGGQLLPDQRDPHSPVFFPLQKCCFCNHTAFALPLIEDLLEDARRRASGLDVLRYTYLRAMALLRRGRPREAQADITAVLEASVEGGWDTGIGGALGTLADALLELEEWDRLDEAVAFAAMDDRPTGMGTMIAAAALARSDLARGRVDAAVRRLRRLQPLADAVPIGEVTEWRITSTLATALAARGERDEAREVAATAVRRAERWGEPRALAQALLAAGAAHGDDGIEQLERACSVLASAESPLDLAQAELALGAALRRANRRADAREPLRRALDLAERCGGVRTARLAREELLATGARPRRAVLSGVAALTPSEVRVARLAADGLSNPEIAQALFITRKTVETHLGRVFRKLGCASRDQLREALTPTTDTEDQGGSPTRS